MPDVASCVLEDFRRDHAESSEAAFEALFRRYQGDVYGWLLRIVRNPSVAEELTVETFWRIYRARARFDPARGFEGWARAIATHAALDWMRNRRTMVELPVDLPAPLSTDPGVAAEIRNKVALAFSRLPPKLRIVAILAVVEEQPHKEIASAVGISVAAVKVRVFRALKRLRKDLERQGIKP
ncbi:MAG TPA: sigma-70 family RNA polymerase sigma factor [Terracidiphilus sp.]|nr:sigma-70 family RNA polymerase sigma factor [Terracidiphilus sp.]